MEALRNSLSRYKLAYILAILIALNVIRYWPHKESDAGPGFPAQPPGAPMNGALPRPNFDPGDPGGPPGRERIEAMLQ